MQQSDTLQLQIQLQAQLTGITEERTAKVEQVLMEIRQHRDALQQQMTLQILHADERARRAEEKARIAEKEHC